MDELVVVGGGIESGEVRRTERELFAQLCVFGEGAGLLDDLVSQQFIVAQGCVDQVTFELVGVAVRVIGVLFTDIAFNVLDCIARHKALKLCILLALRILADLHHGDKDVPFERDGGRVDVDVRLQDRQVNDGHGLRLA